MFQTTRIVAGTFLLGTALFTATVLTAAQPPAERGEKGDKGGEKGGPPRGMRPPIGAIVPPHIVEELQFTDAQKKDLAELQKEVDTRLGKILTDAQKKQLGEMRDRGPGRPGGDKGGPPGGKGDKGGKGGDKGDKGTKGGDKGDRPRPE